MWTQQDINAIRAQRLANTHDPLALMANTQTPFHPDQSSHITYIHHPQPNNHFVQQPLFNTNYMPQLMQNLEDSSDPTTAMNKALALMAKGFKFNTLPTNNNQRSSIIPRNSLIIQPGINTSQDIKMQMVDDNAGNQVRHNAVQNDGNEVRQNAVQNPGIQIVENMKRLSVVLEIANQYGNGNVETTSAEGNGNGINEEEAGIQSTQEEFKFIAAADAYKETERVKVNCTSEDTLQQASTSGTRSDNAPVYDSDGSTEVPKDENYYDHDIFNMLTHKVQYTDLQTELDRTKEKLENCIIKKKKNTLFFGIIAQLGDLKGKSSDTQCASNTLDPLSQKPKDENVSLEFQKHKENAKKSKELGSKGSLASSRPSKPRTCLRWIPSGRIFAMCGKLTASSKTENKSEKSVCDSANTSNPLEPSSKGFLISTFLLGKLSRLRKQHTSIYPIAVL
ncbi:hypothetical protein Tco_1392813 [Tanacetum coccineum]